MATYDYACEACGLRFEAQHGMTEAAPTCPECSSPVRRTFTGPVAVYYHGMGWAKKDRYWDSINREEAKTARHFSRPS